MTRNDGQHSLLSSGWAQLWAAWLGFYLRSAVSGLGPVLPGWPPQRGLSQGASVLLRALSSRPARASVGPRFKGLEQKVLPILRHCLGAARCHLGCPLGVKASYKMQPRREM